MSEPNQSQGNIGVVVAVVAVLLGLPLLALVALAALGVGGLKFWKSAPVYMRPPPHEMVREVDTAPAQPE